MKALLTSKANHSHGEFNPELYGSACRDKQCFTSLRQARGVRRVMLKKGFFKVGHFLNIYRCKGCGYLHIGNSRREEDRS